MPYNPPAATGACLGCGHDDPHTSTLNATCTHPDCGCRDFPARRAPADPAPVPDALSERIRQLDELARDMLSRFRNQYGFPVLFCPSLAEYDRWRDALFGEGGTGGS